MLVGQHHCPDSVSASLLSLPTSFPSDFLRQNRQFHAPANLIHSRYVFECDEKFVYLWQEEKVPVSLVGGEDGRGMPGPVLSVTSV